MSTPRSRGRLVVAPPDPPRRRVVLLLVALVVLAAGAGLLGSAIVMIGAGRPYDTGAPCDPRLRAASSSSGRLTGLNAEQLAVAQQIIDVGKRLAIPSRGWVVALATAMQESTLQNLDYGLDDSLGAFQQRPSMGWGTPEQLRDLSYASERFYRQLTQVPDWQNLPVTRAAQAVQRSGLPDAYARWEGLAAALVTTLGDVADVSGCRRIDVRQEASGAGVKAIAWAQQQLGKPYLWGGTGPRAFDCSGLVMRSYADAGITLPRVASAQYGAGASIPREHAQPGDLVFWANSPANPATIYHVAIYIGGDQVLEAATTGVPIRTRVLRPTEAGLMATVARPAADVSAAA